MKNEEVKEKKVASKKNTNTTKKQTGKTAVKKATPKKENPKKETESKTTTKKNTVKESKKVEEVLEKEIEDESLLDENDDEDLESVVTDDETEKKGLQKSDIALIVGLVVIVILGCFVMGGKKAEPNYTLPLTLSGEAGLQELSYAEYQQKIDNNESFVVVIERATCSHCVSFMPVAEEFAKDNELPMYYVDTDTFTDEEWSTFESTNTYLEKNSGNWGTPTTIVLAGNEAVDTLIGERTADELLELYNKYFDIGE